MKGIVHLFAGILIVGCFIGCNNRPKGVLSSGNMEDFLYDYHIAQAMSDEYNGNQSYKKELLINYVYEKYGVSEAEFDSSLVYYTRHADELTKIYQNLSKRLGKETKGTAFLSSDWEYTGDTASLWVDNTLYRLNSSAYADKITFNIEGDTSFHRKDLIRWSAGFFFLPTGNNLTHTAYMAMRIRYSNDSIVAQEQSIAQSGYNTVSIYAAPNVDIKNISGYIYYINPQASEKTGFMLVNGLKLMRYHSNDSIVQQQRDQNSTPRANIPQPGQPLDVRRVPVTDTTSVNINQPGFPSQRMNPTQVRDSKPIIHKQKIRKQ